MFSPKADGAFAPRFGKNCLKNGPGTKQSLAHAASSLVGPFTKPTASPYIDCPSTHNTPVDMAGDSLTCQHPIGSFEATAVPLENGEWKNLILNF